MKQNRLYYSCMFFMCMFLFACIPQKKIVYFQDKSADDKNNKDTTALVTPVRPKLKVYPNDFLTVVVYTENPEALPGVGMSVDARVIDSRPSYEKGFTIDDAGFITLPLVGDIKVAGLSINEAKDAIAEKYKKYIANPVVVVKKLSFKISVLGEVTKPAIYYVSNEAITLLEALSTAGDLTKYGSRTDIKVIRTINGKQQEFVIDLTDQKALYSQLFFLMQDDVIYVRPLKAKRWADISPQVAVITSVVTVAVAVLTLIVVTAPKYN